MATRRWLAVGAAVLTIGVVLTTVIEIAKARKLASLRASDPVVVTRRAGAAEAPCHLLLIGDSRIADWPLRAPPGWRMTGWGYPGATARTIARLTIPRLAPANADVVVFGAGINDASEGVLAGREGVIFEDTVKALDAFQSAAKGTGNRHVVILTVAPALDPSLPERLVYGSRRDALAKRLSAHIRSLGETGEVGVIDAADLLTTASRPNRLAWRRDSLHWQPGFYRELQGRLFRPPGSETCTAKEHI